jgi:hypothetical protein
MEPVIVPPVSGRYPLNAADVMKPAPFDRWLVSFGMMNDLLALPS